MSTTRYIKNIDINGWRNMVDYLTYMTISSIAEGSLNYSYAYLYLPALLGLR